MNSASLLKVKSLLYLYVCMNSARITYMCINLVSHIHINTAVFVPVSRCARAHKCTWSISPYYITIFHDIFKHSNLSVTELHSAVMKIKKCWKVYLYLTPCGKQTKFFESLCLKVFNFFNLILEWCLQYPYWTRETHSLLSWCEELKYEVRREGVQFWIFSNVYTKSVYSIHPVGLSFSL